MCSDVEDLEGQLQEVLDAKQGKEWDLVGIAGGLQGGDIRFWDNTRPSFGKTDQVVSQEIPALGRWVGSFTAG